MRLGHHFAHAGFDDRRAAGSQHLDFGAAYIHPNNLVSHGGKPGGRDRTDISQPKNANRQAQAILLTNKLSGAASEAHCTIPTPRHAIANWSPSTPMTASAAGRKRFSLNKL